MIEDNTENHRTARELILYLLYHQDQFGPMALTILDGSLQLYPSRQGITKEEVVIQSPIIPKVFGDDWEDDCLHETQMLEFINENLL